MPKTLNLQVRNAAYSIQKNRSAPDHWGTRPPGHMGPDPLNKHIIAERPLSKYITSQLKGGF